LYDYLIWNGIPEKYALREMERGYNWLTKIVSEAQHVILPTQLLKERLEKLGLTRKKVSVIPVCADPPVITDPNRVRLIHNIGSKKVLFYLGSLSAYHDLESVLLALQKIKSKDAVLIVAGGWKKAFKRFERYTKEAKIPIVYVGILSPIELEYYLSAADICMAIYKFSQPSGFFPATVIKYMLAGKAIVATDLPEIREMFKGLKAGLLVQQNDANELALAIDFLLENCEEGIKMGTTAQKIAENNYLWKHHTRALVNIFDSLR